MNTRTNPTYEVVDSLAAWSISEISEIFESSERSLRRWVAEDDLFRRDDGKFPFCTSSFWWLAKHQRKVDPYANPDYDLALLVVRFLSSMGFHKLNEQMLCTAEFLLLVPVSQQIFEEAKDFINQQTKASRLMTEPPVYSQQ